MPAVADRRGRSRAGVDAQNAHYLGYGVFFVLTGRGPYAVDRLLFPALEPTPRLSRLAMPCLRVGTGLGLAMVAFTEKLANPELARAFLQQHPVNFTAWLQSRCQTISSCCAPGAQN